ncbi:MAG: hypothetical protein NTY90_05375 [Candidatus Micrarchaeota archaeon]|nr:hypothetical protein [Candidatus Micrarchaeota archaeon]
MDFTFLFIVILMVFAAQNGLLPIAAGLFLLLLFTAKGKLPIAAAVVGGLLVTLIFVGYNNMLVIGGGLFVVFLLLAKGDSGAGPAGYAGGAYG